MKAEEIDRFIENLLTEIKSRVINEKTKEQVIYELSKALDFYLRKISDIASGINEDDKEKIRKILSDTYICSRVWSAWGVGTMTEDDFTEASCNDDIVDELYNAIS